MVRHCKPCHRISHSQVVSSLILYPPRSPAELGSRDCYERQFLNSFEAASETWGSSYLQNKGEQGGYDLFWVGGVGNKSIDFGCRVQFLKDSDFLNGKLGKTQPC